MTHIFFSVSDSYLFCYVFSGTPTRAKRALDRAPYPYIMVNLFSFDCHVIDRAYVRTCVRVYGLYGWGRGDYKKEGRGALASPHLWYRTFTIRSIDSCQNRIATDQYHMTVSRAHDLQNQIQLLSGVFCYSWLVCLLGFWLSKSRKCDFGWHGFHFSPCLMRKRVEKSEAKLVLLDTFQELHLE